MSATKSMTFPPPRWPFFLHESEWQYQTDFVSFTKNVFLLPDECDGRGTRALDRCLVYPDEVYLVPGEDVRDSDASLDCLEVQNAK